MEKLAVSGRPYVQGTTDTRRVMIDILIALIPAAEAAVVLHAQKLDGAPQHQILRGDLDAHVTKAQVKAVLLGHAVE